MGSSCGRSLESGRRIVLNCGQYRSILRHTTRPRRNNQNGSGPVSLATWSTTRHDLVAPRLESPWLESRPGTTAVTRSFEVTGCKDWRVQLAYRQRSKSKVEGNIATLTSAEGITAVALVGDGARLAFENARIVAKVAGDSASRFKVLVWSGAASELLPFRWVVMLQIFYGCLTNAPSQSKQRPAYRVRTGCSEFMGGAWSRLRATLLLGECPPSHQEGSRSACGTQPRSGRGGCS